MRRQAMTWIGVGAALALGAGEVRADEKHKDKSAASERAKGAAGTGAAGSGTASSGTASSAATPAEATSSQEMRGRVLQASPSRLFIEHMGAVVEFRIDSDAQFSGGDVKSAGDLSEGQEVRASFTVENKTTNVAKRISVSEGSSGGTEPSTTPAPK